MSKKFYAFAHKFEEDVFIKQLDESTVLGIDEALLVSDEETANAILEDYLSTNHFQVIPVELCSFNNGVGEWGYDEVPDAWLD